MKITALRPDDLPFRAPAAAGCAAARAGSAMVKIAGMPAAIDVQFIGTGIATIPNTVQNVFDQSNTESSVDMTWYHNKFVGRHWLLGEFKIVLSEDQESTGTVKAAGAGLLGQNTINVNDFFFKFEFKRLPFLNSANVTPIRNSAVISAVPPIGSVFQLERPADERYLFTRSSSRAGERGLAAPRIVRFNQCDVVVFPERNVGLKLLSKERLMNGSYSVTVEIENTTNVPAVFAYFSVIHYAEVSTDDDYGFVTLKAGQKQKIKYTVTSAVPNRTIDLPFFAALYQPRRLNGSKSLELVFDF